MAIRHVQAVVANDAEGLDLLSESELPADLAWTERSPNIAGAFSRFAAVIDRAGKTVVPEDVRTVS